jgi:hypothetical protein
MSETPKPEEIPAHPHDANATQTNAQPRHRRLIPAVDPLEALKGTWTFGDADTFVREMREESD